MAVFAVIPAAGVGKRFGSDRPKQYEALAGKTILERTIRRIQKSSLIDSTWVALHPDDQHWLSVDESLRQSVEVVTGGAERADSVRLAISSISAAKPDDWVLVHDAVRPLVNPSKVHQMLSSLDSTEAGAIMALPIYETVKKSGNDQVVSETLSRDGLWTAQTPQVFRYQLLKDALEATKGDERITDEASAMEAAGHRVRLFEGHRNNIKITRPEDLRFAEQLIQSGISE